MTRQWHIDLPDQEILSPNDRSHWSKRAACAKSWRLATYAVCGRVFADLVGDLDRVAVTLTHWPADKRRRDPDRNSLVLKWCLDGLVDAGVIEDDDSTHVVSTTCRMEPTKGDKQRHWRLTIEEVGT